MSNNRSPPSLRLTSSSPARPLQLYILLSLTLARSLPLSLSLSLFVFSWNTVYKILWLSITHMIFFTFTIPFFFFPYTFWFFFCIFFFGWCVCIYYIYGIYILHRRARTFSSFFDLIPRGSSFVFFLWMRPRGPEGLGGVWVCVCVCVFWLWFFNFVVDILFLIAIGQHLRFAVLPFFAFDYSQGLSTIQPLVHYRSVLGAQRLTAQLVHLAPFDSSPSAQLPWSACMLRRTTKTRLVPCNLHSYSHPCYY